MKTFENLLSMKSYFSEIWLITTGNMTTYICTKGQKQKKWFYVIYLAKISSAAVVSVIK